ncbi:MAG: tol-pal system protein YbgF [Pelagibacteraceae bacterium TMED233]|nr:MAG: tol-pal system protein YbgF [Pelagibacteraceae bacterium TMED233]
MIVTKKIILNFFLLLLFSFSLNSKILADNHDIFETIELLKKDLKTLERAVYSGNINSSENDTNLENNNFSEDALTRHLLKLSEIEKQFQELTNKFEEINFKVDKLSNRLSKIQADNQIRFQDIENNTVSTNTNNLTNTQKAKKELPGSDQPQDLGAISSYDTSNTSSNQQTQSIDTTSTIVTETFETEEKILPQGSPKEQYEFVTSFLKVGDYSTAEVALREFVVTNPDHELAGSAQYWYAETFRIRQLFTDAASAYLEGYQKFPKSLKAPINLLKLGVSLVEIGEKDQGCSMISGVKKQYPKASQSVLQKAKYEEKKFGCPKSKA